jgi:1-acyl-sn-glycerol-3-phosphate acyltransferase
MKSSPPKPVTAQVRPEITRLPPLTGRRRAFRRMMIAFLRLLVRLLTRLEIHGSQNVPLNGGLLAVINHLGDADFVVGLAYGPRIADTLVKADLYDFPLLGRLLEAYGVIWIHRGQPDRRALRAALQGLAEGRLVGIAPEGRESLTGALEEGTSGAAYLALKAGVPVLPVTFTGTENHRLAAHLKRLRRAPVTMTFGKPFYLAQPGQAGTAKPASGDLRAAVEAGTQQIMHALAEQLPVEYRGVYGQPGESYTDG